jgi:hypothetical protein
LWYGASFVLCLIENLKLDPSSHYIEGFNQSAIAISQSSNAKGAIRSDSDNTEKIREFGSPVFLKRGGKTTRAAEERSVVELSCNLVAPTIYVTIHS